MNSSGNRLMEAKAVQFIATPRLGRTRRLASSGGFDRSPPPRNGEDQSHPTVARQARRTRREKLAKVARVVVPFQAVATSIELYSNRLSIFIRGRGAD